MFDILLSSVTFLDFFNLAHLLWTLQYTLLMCCFTIKIGNPNFKERFLLRYLGIRSLYKIFFIIIALIYRSSGKYDTFFSFYIWFFNNIFRIFHNLSNYLKIRLLNLLYAFLDIPENSQPGENPGIYRCLFSGVGFCFPILRN